METSPKRTYPEENTARLCSACGQLNSGREKCIVCSAAITEHPLVCLVPDTNKVARYTVGDNTTDGRHSGNAGQNMTSHTSLSSQEMRNASNVPDSGRSLAGFVPPRISFRTQESGNQLANNSTVNVSASSSIVPQALFAVAEGRAVPLSVIPGINQQVTEITRPTNVISAQPLTGNVQTVGQSFMPTVSPVGQLGQAANTPAVIPVGLVSNILRPDAAPGTVLTPGGIPVPQQPVASAGPGITGFVLNTASQNPGGINPQTAPLITPVSIFNATASQLPSVRIASVQNSLNTPQLPGVTPSGQNVQGSAVPVTLLASVQNSRPNSTPVTQIQVPRVTTTMPNFNATSNSGLVAVRMTTAVTSGQSTSGTDPYSVYSHSLLSGQNSVTSAEGNRSFQAGVTNPPPRNPSRVAVFQNKGLGNITSVTQMSKPGLPVVSVARTSTPQSPRQSTQTRVVPVGGVQLGPGTGHSGNTIMLAPGNALIMPSNAVQVCSNISSPHQTMLITSRRPTRPNSPATSLTTSSAPHQLSGTQAPSAGNDGMPVIANVQSLAPGHNQRAPPPPYPVKLTPVPRQSHSSNPLHSGSGVVQNVTRPTPPRANSVPVTLLPAVPPLSAAPHSQVGVAVKATNVKSPSVTVATMTVKPSVPSVRMSTSALTPQSLAGMNTGNNNIIVNSNEMIQYLMQPTTAASVSTAASVQNPSGAAASVTAAKSAAVSIATAASAAPVTSVAANPPKTVYINVVQSSSGATIPTSHLMSILRSTMSMSGSGQMPNIQVVLTNSVTRPISSAVCVQSPSTLRPQGIQATMLTTPRMGGASVPVGPVLPRAQTTQSQPPRLSRTVTVSDVPRAQIRTESTDLGRIRTVTVSTPRPNTAVTPRLVTAATSATTRHQPRIISMSAANSNNKVTADKPIRFSVLNESKLLPCLIQSMEVWLETRGIRIGSLRGTAYSPVKVLNSEIHIYVRVKNQVNLAISLMDEDLLTGLANFDKVPMLFVFTSPRGSKKVEKLCNKDMVHYNPSGLSSVHKFLMISLAPLSADQIEALQFFRIASDKRMFLEVNHNTVMEILSRIKSEDIKYYQKVMGKPDSGTAGQANNGNKNSIEIGDVINVDGTNMLPYADKLLPLADEDSDDDVIMVSEARSIKCPYTQQVMKDPVKNRHCLHNYDKDAVLEMIRVKKGVVKCPMLGCSNPIPLLPQDLLPDDDLKKYITSLDKSAS